MTLNIETPYILIKFVQKFEIVHSTTCLHKSICHGLWNSLEAPHRAASKEYTQDKFSWQYTIRKK